MLIIPLGVNGYMPSFRRQTASFLVVANRHALFLDAGTGFARLRAPSIKSHLDGCETVSIVLSHYHLDHVVGLAYLPGLLPNREVTILGPAPPLTTYGPKEALTHLLHPSLFSLPLDQFPTPPRIECLRKREICYGPHIMELRQQQHDDGSVAIRLGDLVYVTDTPVTVETMAFARGAKVLLHEAWIDDVTVSQLDMLRHSCCRDVARLAADAGVPKLMPVHIHPSWDTKRVRQVCNEMNQIHGGIVFPRECRPLSWDE